MDTGAPLCESCGCEGNNSCGLNENTDCSLDEFLCCPCCNELGPEGNMKRWPENIPDPDQITMF